MIDPLLLAEMVWWLVQWGVAPLLVGAFIIWLLRRGMTPDA